MPSLGEDQGAETLVERLSAEIARLHSLAKASNDYARLLSDEKRRLMDETIWRSAEAATLTARLAALEAALKTADALFHAALKLPAEEQHLWLFSKEGCDAWQSIRSVLFNFDHELSAESRATLEKEARS